MKNFKVEWRNAPEVYKKRIQKLIDKANKEKPSHVIIPHPDTNPEERKKNSEKQEVEKLSFC